MTTNNDEFLYSKSGEFSLFFNPDTGLVNIIDGEQVIRLTMYLNEWDALCTQYYRDSNY
jgi:hypothetical protein